MTEQQLPGKGALAVSPYLSLRQAVHPLMFAHALLASRRALAAQFAEECERLSRLTSEALEAAGSSPAPQPTSGPRSQASGIVTAAKRACSTCEQH